MVQSNAGLNAGFTNEDYKTAGCDIFNDFSEIRNQGDILIDVKQRIRQVDLLSKPTAVHIFYAHIEKGQGPEQFQSLVSARATAYSPETIWLPESMEMSSQSSAEPVRVRGVNLGYYAGLGSAHLALRGLQLSNANGKPNELYAKFENLPDLGRSDYETLCDYFNDYQSRTTHSERIKVAILGSKRGRCAQGAFDEFQKIGVTPTYLDRTITRNKDNLQRTLKNYDILLNTTVWNRSDPRIIGLEQIKSMKQGAVFVDVTCDTDRSSTSSLECEPGKSLIGGVRFSYESSWGESNMFYWVGPNHHSFAAADPLAWDDSKFRVLYCTNGMIPGGRATAKRASESYSSMIFPTLLELIRAKILNIDLPKNGLVMFKGLPLDPELTNLYAAS